VKGGKKLWSLLIDFRTAFCVSSFLLSFSLFLITSVNHGDYMEKAQLFFSYRTLCNKFYLFSKALFIALRRYINVKSHNYRSFPA